MQIEIIYIDDGSKDSTLEKLKHLATGDSRIVVLELSRNFGQQAAMSAGLETAKGDAVVIIDADLQDPPEVILEMVAKWRTGIDVAYGRRKSREGESVFKLISASMFYRFFAAMMPYSVPVDTGDFKLCDRAVVDTVCALPEKRRYLRNLIPWAGFHHAPVDYDRDARTAGETKYSVFKLLSLAADALLLSSDKPVRVIWLSAFFFAIVGAFGLVASLTSSTQDQTGILTILAVIGFISATQTVGIAIVGEYTVRCYRETQGRPTFIIRKKYNNAV
jgi:dolichol-phosphate mannosyltransferase